MNQTPQSEAIQHCGHEVRPLLLKNVQIEDYFWSPRQERVRTATIPAQLEQLKIVGHLRALAGKCRPDDRLVPHIFWDSDVAKWIEAASYTLETHPDPDLDRAVDEVVELLAGAQQPDGYLNTYFTVVQPGERFTDLRDAHELYCAGHLIEAGVAHFEATGKRRLLDIVRRYADLIDKEFGPQPGQKRGYDGHEEIELALVRLYKTTGEQRYLRLATYFIDERGQQPYYFDAEAAHRGTQGYFAGAFPNRAKDASKFREYSQTDRPVRELTKVQGHAVRAMYLYSAMTDIATETGDESLLSTCRTLWRHLTTRRIYITGGIGSSSANEGFTQDFDLPDFDAYAETCAAIGLVFWSSRMAHSERDGRYSDMLERALYNGVLSGLASDGTCFFYDNPLASHGDKHRHEWFGVACCPPNIARTISSLGSYIYGRSDRDLFVDLFIGSRASLNFHGHEVTLVQKTAYPWDGQVSLEVIHETAPIDFTIHVRIPAWAEAVSIGVNGQNVASEKSAERGYVTIQRDWASGDTVQVDLSLSSRRTWGNPAVSSTRGRVALERGPLVYCVEDADHPDGVGTLELPRGSELRVDSEVLDAKLGVLRISAKAVNVGSSDWGDVLYRPSPPSTATTTLSAIPYFSWGNRAQGSMQVWIRDSIGSDNK